MYQILKRIGLVTYEIVMSPYFTRLRNVFHMSYMYKYISNLTLEPNEVLYVALEDFHKISVRLIFMYYIFKFILSL